MVSLLCIFIINGWDEHLMFLKSTYSKYLLTNRVLSYQTEAHKVLYSIHCVDNDDPLSKVKMTTKHVCSVK